MAFPFPSLASGPDLLHGTAPHFPSASQSPTWGPDKKAAPAPRTAEPLSVSGPGGCSTAPRTTSTCCSTPPDPQAESQATEPSIHHGSTMRALLLGTGWQQDSVSVVPPRQLLAVEAFAFMVCMNILQSSNAQDAKRSSKVKIKQ